MNTHSIGVALWRGLVGMILLMLYSRVMPKDTIGIVSFFVILAMLFAAVLLSYEPE